MIRNRRLACTSISSVPEERAVINKERRSGAYRLSAYFFAKMTSEFPVMILRPIAFVTVIYWSAGLPKDAGIFFGILGTVLLTSLSSQVRRDLIFRDQKYICGLFGTYHACWCPGDLSCQGISRHGIDSIVG